MAEPSRTRLMVRQFDEPDEVFEAEGVRTETITLGSASIGRTTHAPGWRWSTHVMHLVGTDLCRVQHTGIVLAGRLAFRLEDGTEGAAGPGDAFSVPPGHDGWVVGDEPVVVIEWTGADEWLRPPGSQRVMATMVLTDIVESTAHVQRLGDQRWRGLLGAHDDAMRNIIEHTRGREIKATGDGFLVAYDGAARAVGAAARMRRAALDLRLSIRAAVHAGEVELVGSDVRGLAVHEAARILELAAPAEILVSEVTRLLATGAGLSFTERGRHRLRGLDREVAVFALDETPVSRGGRSADAD